MTVLLLGSVIFNILNVANWNLGKVKLETIFAGQRLVPEVGAVLGFIQGLQ